MPRHVIYGDGLYRDVRRGISRGCPLSPLLGALYLQALDVRLGLFYVRLMDDWVAMVPTRWKLRGAIKTVNQAMNELKLGKHPDKTFIGRIERGIDFLGHHLSPEGQCVSSPLTNERCASPPALLYEQGYARVRLGHVSAPPLAHAPAPGDPTPATSARRCLRPGIQACPHCHASPRPRVAPAQPPAPSPRHRASAPRPLSSPPARISLPAPRA